MPGRRAEPIDGGPVLSEAQAAELLGVKPDTLMRRRLAGDGPPYRRPMGIVRYLREEVLAWVAAHPNEGARS